MRRSLLLGLLGLLLLPAGANAGVVSIDGTVLRYAGEPGGDDNISIRRATGTITVTNNGPGDFPFSATPPCNETSPNFTIECPDTNLTRVVAATSDGNDSVGFSDLGAIVAEADLGDGNDTANPVDEMQPFLLILKGGAGRDNLLGGKLNDIIDGGPDSDLIDGGGGPDDLRGGTGFDELHYDVVVGRVGGVNVTLDDKVGDGGPNEGDNAHSDLEDLYGTDDNDVLVGSAASNFIQGLCGNDEIDGLGGFDVVFADVEFTGCAGNDTVRARDGLGERINCGPGTDKVTSDDIDGVSECETNDSSPDAVLDRDNDGSDKPGDCDDTNPQIHPGAPDVLDDGIDQDCDGADDLDLDRDNDNFNRPQDCDDNRANVFPGADEIPANGRDEDCNGSDARAPVVGATFTFETVPAGRRTRFTSLLLDNLRRGDRIRLSCTKGCKRRNIRARRTGQRSLTRFVRRPLAPGARVEIRVSRTGFTTVVFRLTMRRGRQPRTQTLCLPSGARRPTSCG